MTASEREVLTAMSPPPPRTGWHLRRPRFALRTLLILITVAAAGAAYLGGPTMDYYREQQLADEIRDLGGRVALATPPEKGLAWRIANRLGVPEFFDRIRAVDLTNTPTTDNDLPALGSLTALKELSLSGTKVTDACGRELSKCHALKMLEVSDTQVTDKLIDSLDSLPLSYLGTKNTAITYSALQRIGEASVRKRLTECLAGGTVLDDGKEAYLFLGENSDLGRIRDLVRFQCDDPQLSISVHLYEGIADHQVLALLGTLPRLVSLHASSDQLQDGDVRQLSSCWALRDLRIFSPNFTPAVLEQIVKFPNLKVLQLPRAAMPKDVSVLSRELPKLNEIRFFPEHEAAVGEDRS